MEQQQAGRSLVIGRLTEQADDGRTLLGSRAAAHAGEVTGQAAVVVGHAMTQGALDGTAGQQVVVLAEAGLVVAPLHAQLVLRQQVRGLFMEAQRALAATDPPAGFGLQLQADLQAFVGLGVFHTVQAATVAPRARPGHIGLAAFRGAQIPAGLG
ncbi:hypothetical protein D3C71_1759490 [compost metagenome]